MGKKQIKNYKPTNIYLSKGISIQEAVIGDPDAELKIKLGCAPYGWESDSSGRRIMVSYYRMKLANECAQKNCPIPPLA